MITRLTTSALLGICLWAPTAQATNFDYNHIQVNALGNPSGLGGLARFAFTEGAHFVVRKGIRNLKGTGIPLAGLVFMLLLTNLLIYTANLKVRGLDAQRMTGMMPAIWRRSSVVVCEPGSHRPLRRIFMSVRLFLTKTIAPALSKLVVVFTQQKRYLSAQPGVLMV